MTADRPVTEPRSRAIDFARCPQCLSDSVMRLPDDWQEKVNETPGRAIPIIACGNPWHYATASLAEAAQGAAPLDCRDGHDERMTMDFDGEPIRCIRCKAPSEEAAPRAEGQPHAECIEAYHRELLLSGRTIMSVARVRADVAAAEAAQGAAPRAEGLDAERLIGSLDRIKRVQRKTIMDVNPEDFGFDMGVAAAQDAIRSYVRRLSRPSDERVPESEEPR